MPSYIIPVSGKSQNVKNLIIYILSNEWPLSAKKIYNLVRKNGPQVTYQAVHKALKEMERNCIIKRSGKDYQLDTEWIKRLKDFGHTLFSAYSNDERNKFNLNKLDSPIYIVFNSFIEYARFLVNDFYINYPNPDKKVGVCFWNHVYCVLGVTEKEQENLKRIFKENRHYSVSRYDTIIDRWVSSYLGNIGKVCLTGIEYNSETDTFVNGDFIMQAAFPSSFRKELDKMYRKPKTIEEFKPEEYLELINKRLEIGVIVFRNEKLAERLRKEALGYFKGKI